jgi:hypothetical protein
MALLQQQQRVVVGSGRRAGPPALPRLQARSSANAFRGISRHQERSAFVVRATAEEQGEEDLSERLASVVSGRMAHSRGASAARKRRVGVLTDQ